MRKFAARTKLLEGFELVETFPILVAKKGQQYNTALLYHTIIYYTTLNLQHAHFIPIVGVGKRGGY